MALFAAVLAHLESLGAGAGYFILLLASGFVFVCMIFFSFLGGDTHDGSGDVPDGHFDLHTPDGSQDVPDNDGDLPSPESGADHGPDLFKYLSFRNCINYLLGFSACGFMASLGGLHPFVSAVLALSGGFISAIIMYKLMAVFYSLSDAQPLRMQEALGETAKVYIRIGAKRSERGKILLKVKGAQREYSAVTDNETELRMGTMVRVTDVAGDNYVVEPVSNGASGSVTDV